MFSSRTLSLSFRFHVRLTRNGHLYVCFRRRRNGDDRPEAQCTSLYHLTAVAQTCYRRWRMGSASRFVTVLLRRVFNGRFMTRDIVIIPLDPPSADRTTSIGALRVRVVCSTLQPPTYLLHRTSWDERHLPRRIRQRTETASHSPRFLDLVTNASLSH